MDKRVKYAVRRNPASEGMRKTPLTPEEITKFRILKKLTGKALERRLPAWARKKSIERFAFTPGQKARYPGWTYAKAPAPAELKFPDPNREWTVAAYIKEFNRLNGLKQNPRYRANPSRKDYRLLAATFLHVRGEILLRKLNAMQVWTLLLHEVADYFQSDNPRFDRGRFYHAAGETKTNPASGKYGPRIRRAARTMVKRYGKRRARSIAGGMIGTSKSRRMKEHFVKVRRAINPQRAKYEIQANKRWIPVTSHIFRSWAGKRRLNGKAYSGPRYYLGTNTLYKK